MFGREKRLMPAKVLSAGGLVMLGVASLFDLPVRVGLAGMAAAAVGILLPDKPKA